MRCLRRNRTVNVLAVLVAAILLLTATAAESGTQETTRTYRVTIQNLTDGQALTPPVIATHEQHDRFFRVGDAASGDVQAIAENGNSDPLVNSLSVDTSVLDLAVGASGPLVPAADPGGTGFGDSVNLLINGDHNSKYLSTISMLICSNDGFSGLNSLRLPGKGSSIALTPGLDAGTEINTEDYADLVPPCQSLFGVTSPDPGPDQSDPALAEGGVISYHGGIQGIDDLPAGVHDWINPVVKTTITCIDEDAVIFSAPMSGAGELAPVCTFATGKANFILAHQMGKLYFMVDVGQIFGVTQAHIHYGLPDASGPAVAFLYGPEAPTGFVKGRLAMGMLQEEDLLDLFTGDFEGFIAALRNGELYVNVHTVRNPGGEIRGQIGAMARRLKHVPVD